MRPASRIINDTIVPLFKQGDFFGGINAGLDQMLRVIDGEPLPAPGSGLEAGWQARCAAAVPAVRRNRRVAACCATSSAARRWRCIAGLGGGGLAWWLTSRIPLSAGIGVGAFLLALMLGGRGGRGGRGRGGGTGRVFRDIGGGGLVASAVSAVVSVADSAVVVAVDSAAASADVAEAAARPAAGS